MEFLERITKVIDYIEAHITEDINFEDVSKIVCCGVYQFGRIFSYVVGVSLTEYIRRRRLTLAALELQQGNVRVIDVALKYGYNSPDSFTRAFHSMHGVTPKEACTLGTKLRLYPRITFYITIKGGINMEYRIVEKEAFEVVGAVKNFGKWGVKVEASNWQDKMNDVWIFWDEFLNKGMNEKIGGIYKLYREPFWQMGVTKTLGNGETVVAIGAESNGKEYTDLETFEVPASTWAVFNSKGSLNHEEHPIEALMTRIITEWFPTSGYEKSMPYEIEVYGPGDTQSEDYICEVWIPVKKSKM